MYQCLVGMKLGNAHRALKDAEALVIIFRHKTVWQKRNSSWSQLLDKSSGSDYHEALDAVANDEFSWRPECFGDHLRKSDVTYLEAEERYQHGEPDISEDDDVFKEGWESLKVFKGVDSPTKFMQKRRSIVVSPAAT